MGGHRPAYPHAGPPPAYALYAGNEIPGDCRGRGNQPNAGQRFRAPGREEAAKVFQKKEVDEGGTMNLLEEKRKIETELHQLQNRQKILLNKKANAERKARTHRLIERGAILESVFPAVAAMTGEEVGAFLLVLSRLPGAGEVAAKSAKTGDAG